MEFLVLHFEAPMMSFGGVAVDNDRPTDAHPGRSLLTGLVANALGWRHGDVAALGRLQARLVVGAREDRPGEVHVDYQTADLGQSFFLPKTWTTRGRVVKRASGNARGTHIRYRHYLHDAVYTVVLGVEPADESPTLEEIERALARPARPLYLGRKSCLPSGPILWGRLEAESVRAALEAAPLGPRRGEGPVYRAWWPAEGGGGAPRGSVAGPGMRLIHVWDERDWRNQVHLGRRGVIEGRVSVADAETQEG